MGRDLNVRKILTRKKTDLPPIAQSCARMERVDFFGMGKEKKRKNDMKRIAMVLMLLPPLVGLYSKTLEIEVPKANIIGTPAPIKSMNL